MMLQKVILLCAPAILWAQTDSIPPSTADLAKQVALMNAIIQQLQHRVDELEARQAAASPPAIRPAAGETALLDPAPAPAVEPSPQAVPQTPQPKSELAILAGGTSLNLSLDSYYANNFNNPIGRVNRLRAYDVLSNAFSLNQASVVMENPPDVNNGKRWGLRLDLQFGQATATLQGNSTNEPRAQVYRNIFQAYGTYIVPIGKGLTVDFGKWASSLGIENNFTQDQINYSRSYWFNFLPFYHMGARVSYPLTPVVTLNYWIVNGTQQTEPFNDFKDQFGGLTIQPTKNLAWTVNYYLGQEHPNVALLPNSTDPTLPTLQGEPFLPIPNAPKGKLHIFDSYATWQTTPKLTLALEADYLIQRLFTNSYPARTWGGAGYARYQISPRIAIAGRAEYLADQGGLFTGITQALKETTVTLEQKMLEGFLLREEWRRDFSNQLYFFTSQLGVLKREQNTATLGVVWWFGPKKSPW
jgi:Putative beta-barrel porin-2, OmpL-like. bbp2